MGSRRSGGLVTIPSRLRWMTTRGSSWSQASLSASQPGLRRGPRHAWLHGNPGFILIPSAAVSIETGGSSWCHAGFPASKLPLPSRETLASLQCDPTRAVLKPRTARPPSPGSRARHAPSHVHRHRHPSTPVALGRPLVGLVPAQDPRVPWPLPARSMGRRSTSS